MAGIQDYNTTAALNVDGWVEGMSPANVNNVARQDRVNLRNWYNDPSWIEYGTGSGAGNGTDPNYTATYSSGPEFLIEDADVSAVYNVGRKIRMTVDGGAFVYGTISAVSYSSPDTTITVDWLDAGLTSGVLRVWLGADSGDSETTALSGAAFTGQQMAPELKGPTETVQAIAIVSSGVTFDVADGGVVQITLNANIATWTITWPSGASSFFVELTQDGTGNWTVAWPAAWTWPAGTEPIMTSAAGAVDMIAVASFDGGATIRAQAAGQGYA